jgi:hypothetical protein
MWVWWLLRIDYISYLRSKNDLEMADITLLLCVFSPLLYYYALYPRNNVYHLILAGFRCAYICTR